MYTRQMYKKYQLLFSFITSVRPFSVLRQKTYFQRDLRYRYFTVQGNFYEQWVDEEFEYLKAVVNEITTNTLQVLNLTSEDLAITPKSPRILQPSPKVGQSLQGMIQAVENRVCEHLKLIENKLSRFEERITKIENDVDVLRTVEEKLNINEDRTGNLEKELQKIERTTKNHTKRKRM